MAKQVKGFMQQSDVGVLTVFRGVFTAETQGHLQEHTNPVPDTQWVLKNSWVGLEVCSAHQQKRSISLADTTFPLVHSIHRHVHKHSNQNALLFPCLSPSSL